MQNSVMIFSGRINLPLSQSIADYMGLPLSSTILENFANGEIRFEAKESCRRYSCFIIQSLCKSEDGTMSVNDALVELLIMISALRAASARSITVVIPIFAYARQDKTEERRAAITARLVADLLQTSGIDSAIMIDLHASQIQGFFSKPVDNIRAAPILTKHIQKHFDVDNIVIVTPDAGGAKRASWMANVLNCDCAIISKERKKVNEVASMKLVGNVLGKIAILIDDMADTCGTLCKASDTLMGFGALEVHAYVTHGIFSKNAIQKINSSTIKSVVCTNSIPQIENKKKCKKLFVIDISKLLAGIISVTAKGGSITEYYRRASL